MRKAVIVAGIVALSSAAPAMAQTNPQFQGQFAQGNTAPEKTQNSEMPVYLGHDVIREVQSELTRQGYNPGASNGVWTPQTTSALQAYQQANHIEPTGNIDISTLYSLGVPRKTLTAILGEDQHAQRNEGAGKQGEAFGSPPGNTGSGSFGVEVKPNGEQGFTFRGYGPGGDAYGQVGPKGFSGNFNWRD